MNTKEQFRQLPIEVQQAIDEADTAFAVLDIGRDHGITPQAAAACREAWQKILDVMGRESIVSKHAFKME